MDSTCDHENFGTSFKENILHKPVYWISIAFISILGFGFDIMNRTLGVDNLERWRYSGSGNRFIRGTRWGMDLYITLFGNPDIYNPYVERIEALTFLIISAVLLSRILYTYFRNSPCALAICTLFSCLYISFPLQNELWNYTAANIARNCNAVIIAVVLLYLHDKDSIFGIHTFISSMLLTYVVSSYESTIFAYISVVLFILMMDLIVFDRKNWFFSGIKYALPLAGAVILRFAVGLCLLKGLGLDYTPNGKTEINWNFSEALWPQVKKMLTLNLDRYFLRGLIYFPIMVFVIASISGTICALAVSIKRKNPLIFLLYSFTYISVFALSILQGSVIPYRTAQTVHLFSAVSISMSVFALSLVNKRTVFRIFFVIACFLCYRQGISLNESLSLNNQRSDNEAGIIYNLGYEIKANYPADKTVIFVGNLDLGDIVDNQKKIDTTKPGGWLYRKIAIHLGWSYDIKLYETNVKPLMTVYRRFYGGQKPMADLFAYYGFDIKTRSIISQKEIDQYTKIARSEGMKPLEIKDMGDYILVFMG